MTEPTNQKGFSPVIIIMILAVVIALGAIFIPMISKNSQWKQPANQDQQTLQSQSIAPSVTPQPTLTVDPYYSTFENTLDWKTYTNSKYGFSLKYRNDEILEVKSSENAEVVLKNTNLDPSYCKNHKNETDCLPFITQLDIAVVDNPGNLSAHDFAQKEWINRFGSLENKDNPEFGFAGTSSLPAYIKPSLEAMLDSTVPIGSVYADGTSGACGESDIYIVHNDKVIELTYYCAVSPTDLHTFKFTQ